LRPGRVFEDRRSVVCQKCAEFRKQPQSAERSSAHGPSFSPARTRLLIPALRPKLCARSVSLFGSRRTRQRFVSSTRECSPRRNVCRLVRTSDDITNWPTSSLTSTGPDSPVGEQLATTLPHVAGPFLRVSSRGVGDLDCTLHQPLAEQNELPLPDLPKTK
jgi:hypothetical protein